MPVIDRIWWRIRRAALAFLTTVAVLAVVSVITSWVDRKLNADEEYAVYSAYLSEGLLNDAHDWSVSGPIQVVIEDTTEAGGNLRWSALYVLDGRVGFDQLHASTRASFLVRNLVHTRIQPKFVLPSRATVVLGSKSDIEPRLQGSPEFQKKFPHNMGFIILSGVGFNVFRTQAVFYIDHFCGLCGGGRYVLMEKANGSWQVRDEHYTWIS